jgi:UDP-MurNAc hydroxylase
MPFADQYMVAGSRGHLNRFIAHPPCPGVVETYIQNQTFDSQLLLLNSNQTYDFATDIKQPDAPYQHFTEADRDQYQQSIHDAKYDHEHFELNPSVPLDRLVSFARARLWQMQQMKNYFPEQTLYLEAQQSQRRFKIDLTQEKIEECGFHSSCAEPFLKISVPDVLLMMMLIGHVSWNIADAALFIDYERRPNIYDGKIYEFINYLRV